MVSALEKFLLYLETNAHNLTVERSLGILFEREINCFTFSSFPFEFRSDKFRDKKCLPRGKDKKI